MDSRTEIDLPSRTFKFAIRIVHLCRFLNNNQKDIKIISNQLFRSGTSIGANVEEGQGAQSKADFINKYHIALKEARETSYWLRILIETETLPSHQLHPLLEECEEIKKIIGSSLITIKSKD